MSFPEDVVFQKGDSKLGSSQSWALGKVGQTVIFDWCQNHVDRYKNLFREREIFIFVSFGDALFVVLAQVT